MFWAYLFLGVIFLILFSCVITEEKYRDKFGAILKNKKTWVIIPCIPVAPFVLYAVGTLILFAVRGNCFTAYHEYVGDYHFICYEDAYYIEVTDEDEINRIYDSDLKWTANGEFVTTEPVGFPYYHYWLPNIFWGDLIVEEGKQYIQVVTHGGGSIWQRVEE